MSDNETMQAIALRGSRFLSQQGLQMKYLEHALTSEAESRLKLMFEKYGPDFFTTPLMTYVKSLSEDRRASTIKSIVADIEALNAMVDIKHAAWDESKVKRDGSGQFARQASSSIDSVDKLSEWLRQKLGSTSTDSTTTEGWDSDNDGIDDTFTNTYRKTETDADGNVTVTGYTQSFGPGAENNVSVLDLIPDPATMSYAAKMWGALKQTDDYSPFLAHYGVKGMKWGVRKRRDGTGTVKVKFRPTYNNEERRQAKSAVKTAGKGGKVALDREGKEQARLAKLNTPQRRGVNAMLGTKYQWATVPIAAAGVASAILSGSPELTIGLIGTASATRTAADVHAGYKVFAQNYKNNPTAKLKTDLSAKEIAAYGTGKTVTKTVLSKRGSATVSLNKKGSTVTVMDREGRTLGSQRSVKATRKLDKPPKPPKEKSKS